MDQKKEEGIKSEPAASALTEAAPATQWHNPRIADVVETRQGIFLIVDSNKNGVHRAINGSTFAESYVHPADILAILGNAGKTFGMALPEAAGDVGEEETHS